MDVPGIDMIFIGPNDLHLQLGLPASLWSENPIFLEAVKKVFYSSTSVFIYLYTDEIFRLSMGVKKETYHME